MCQFTFTSASVHIYVIRDHRKREKLTIIVKPSVGPQKYSIFHLQCGVCVLCSLFCVSRKNGDEEEKLSKDYQYTTTTHIQTTKNILLYNDSRLTTTY